MIRVVVVDDEPYILRSIKKSIERAHTEFVVVGEALDGEEALEIIEATSPDIVFTDIRMPVIDGLGLIEELRKRKLKVLPVILSGYQDFEYAKKAIRLEVVDYLLKPINPETLTKLLHELYEEVTRMKRNQQLNILELLIKNNLFPREIQLDIQKPFSEYVEYGCLYICSGPYCTYTCSQFTPSRELWFNINLDDVISISLETGENYWVIDGEQSNEKIIILGFSAAQAFRFSKIALHIHRTLDQLRYCITTIASKVSGEIAPLPALVQKFRAIMRHKNIFGESRFINDTELLKESHLISGLISSSQEKTLHILIQNQQLSQLKVELKKMLEACKEQHCTQYILEKILRQTYTMLYNFQGSAVMLEEKIDQLLSESESYTDVYENLCFAIDELFRSKNSEKELEDDILGIISKVDNYIAKNYTKQMSLQAIAHMFGLTQSYLSNIYKKCKGISPLECIIHLKIEKAKELLLIQPPISMKEISDAIGYEDPYYFSRIFKTVVGKSPTKFREETCGVN